MAALTDEEAREALRLLATAHHVLLGDPPKNAEQQPAWWSQYGRISYLAKQLDGPNADIALAGLREVVRPAFVAFHEGRPPEPIEPPEWQRKRPTE
jgi:hypothetical protein